VPLALLFEILIVSVRGYYQRDFETKTLASANVIAGGISKSGVMDTLVMNPDAGADINAAPGQDAGSNLTREQQANQIQQFDADMLSKSKEYSFRILVLDNTCRVVGDSNMSENGKIFVVPEVVTALRKNGKVTTHDAEKTVYAAAAITDKDGNTDGAVLAVASSAAIYDALDSVSRQLLLLTAITAIILGVVIFFVSKLLIDPLQKILPAIQKMSDGHLNERIPVSGRDEFAELAAAFNEMTEKLEQVEKTREEFVSNVSHELKTPLSSIKVLSESVLTDENAPVETYREFLNDITSEVDRMTSIVNDLLQLVKLDNKDTGLNLRQTDVNKVIEDILKRLYPLAEHKDIELLYEDVRRVSIEADEMKLSLALSNLIENGIKYTQEGGTVKVIVDADHQNAFITVQDTGIGISEDDHGKIFTRFYRVDKTRDRETGGTGLGLSITRATILMHNGSIRVLSKEGEGATFIVRIPIHHIGKLKAAEA